MKRTIFGAVLAALLALPAIAVASPDSPKWRDDKAFQIRETAMGFTCSTGNATSLLVGAAVIGVIARRRK